MELGLYVTPTMGHLEKFSNLSCRNAEELSLREYGAFKATGFSGGTERLGQIRHDLIDNSRK